MSDDTTTPQDDVTTQQPPADDGQQAQDTAPPWGSDDQFDPDKAWRLIQNLRGDLDKVKNDRETFKSKVDEFENANKTELERLSESKQQAETAAAKARTEAIRLRMAIKYSLEEEDLDLLGAGTEEDIEARAKRLAERVSASPTAGGRTTTRPQESLRPGATPDGEPDPTDMNALLHAAVRGG